MFAEVLRAFKDRKLLIRRDLARKLGVQESAVEHILFILETRGYLKRLDSAGGCGDCRVCPFRSLCPVGGSPRRAANYGIYVLTEKGRKYLEKHDP